MVLRFPNIHTDPSQKVYVSFYVDGKRYRLYNGRRINSTTNPNSYPVEQRLSIAEVLAAEIYGYLINGGTLLPNRKLEELKEQSTDLDFIKLALNKKLSGCYSQKYKDMLQFCFECLEKECNTPTLSVSHLKNILDRYSSSGSYNTIKRHINVLLNEAVTLGMAKNPMISITQKKSNAILHKPIRDVKELLTEIKLYNYNLYICSLITYGCLLRPHREIRELTWGDFTEDLSYINLSGERNKSGKNRIVPVPNYVRQEINKGASHNNIFSGKSKPLNKDYFKTLWGRFRKQSKVLEEGQTLYSFRHTGAIDIFKRTGSITKLQKAMGHSSINVSLVYLRGLEVAELMEEDMPSI